MKKELTPTTTKGELLQDERETFNLMLDRLEEKNKKLLDSNRELLDACELALKEELSFIFGNDELMSKLITAINNAKNLQP